MSSAPVASAAPAATERAFIWKAVESFTTAQITAYIEVNGAEAPLFKDKCTRCEDEFTIKAFTAVRQIRRYGRFRPPTFCKKCFTTYHQAVSTPGKPANARMKRAAPIPDVLPQVLLRKLRNNFEGRPVSLLFRKKVSFSSQDESRIPETGRCLHIMASSITIYDGVDVLTARTYPLKDIRRIMKPTPERLTAPLGEIAATHTPNA